jgi:hypothetical protein
LGGILASPTDWANLQIFELTIGNALFEYRACPEYSLDETTAHLWQILGFTRERMTREQVESSKLGAQYFDLAVNPDDVDNPFCLSSLLWLHISCWTLTQQISGDLKAHPPTLIFPFVAIIRKYKVLEEEEDVLAMAKIMQRCLRLNPKDRATAEELLQDPWWQGAA